MLTFGWFQIDRESVTTFFRQEFQDPVSCASNSSGSKEVAWHGKSREGMKVMHPTERAQHTTNNKQSHRIHGTGIFTYIYHKNHPNVGIYRPYVDPMGINNNQVGGFQILFLFHH